MWGSAAPVLAPSERHICTLIGGRYWTRKGVAVGCDLTARKAIARKTGARGLRSIMEGILLDTMFELPSLEGVEKVVISQEVVEGTAPPLYLSNARANAAS